jgi:DNA-binding LacI/PurR family transcriptional regulator
LETGGDLDAVFASNDQMALGVLHGAHRLGRIVPDELSVAGVDDIAEGSHFTPPLTTVHQPLRDAGAMAVTMIDALVEEANSLDEPGTAALTAATQNRLLTPELIVRESTRSPRLPMPAMSSDELPYRNQL